MTVKQKNKIYSILICLLGVAAVVLALVIAIQPSPEKEAISDAKKMASEAAEAKENEEKLKEESARQEAEKQEAAKSEESSKEAAKKEESVKTEESAKQESSKEEEMKETEESSNMEESSKNEEESVEESAPVHVSSGSGTMVSDSGTNLNLIVDWSIDTDASGNATLTLTASLETYGLSASSREEGLYVTIGDDVEVFSTEAVENTEDELAVIPLKTVILDWPGGTHNVQVSWRFGGVYGGTELDYIIAEGRISD